MLAQVLDEDRRSGGGERPGLALAQVPVVEGIEPVARERFERGGEGRQADALTGMPGAAVWSVHGREAGIGAEFRVDERGGHLHGVDEPVPGREAGTCQLDGRGQRLVPRQAAEPRVGVAPRADRAGHGDAEGPAPREAGQPTAAQCRRIARGCAPPGPVQGVVAGGSGIPDQPEGVAPDAAAAGHHDPEDRVGRDRGIHGGATGSQHVQPGRGRKVMRRHDRAVRAAGQRDRAPGMTVDHPIIPVTGSSAPRRRASGRSAITSSTAVATSIPSMPTAVAAKPPMSAPAIWPIARKTE